MNDTRNTGCQPGLAWSGRIRIGCCRMIEMPSLLTIVGLVLAILDFTGWSEALERRLDRGRGYCRRWARAAAAGLKARLADTGGLYGHASLGMGIVVYVYLATRLVVSAVRVQDDSHAWLVLIAMGVVAIPPAIALAAGLLWMLWAVLYVLNMPKKGTVGTIGFLVALLGAALEIAGS